MRLRRMVPIVAWVLIRGNTVFSRFVLATETSLGTRRIDGHISRETHSETSEICWHQNQDPVVGRRHKSTTRKLERKSVHCCHGKAILFRKATSGTVSSCGDL